MCQTTVPAYVCFNKKSGEGLGLVLWQESWKQWVFQPNDELMLVFSVACLQDIIHFIGQLIVVPEKK